MISLNNFHYLAWEMTEEAWFKKGVELHFDAGNKLTSFNALPDIPQRCMRPTLVKANLNGKDFIFFMGGLKDLVNQVYDVEDKTWFYTSKLPAGHTITTNVCCNYENRVIFTLMLDSQMNIKCAALDLENLPKHSEMVQVNEEMNWALRMKQTDHQIDRFHLKTAVQTSDGRIACIARGRTKDGKEQVSSLCLFFLPEKVNDQWTLKLVDKQIHFPTVFPRQMDHLFEHGDKLIMVNDTTDSDPFEVMTVFTKLKRRKGDYQEYVWADVVEDEQDKAIEN